jgi:hypothetical protein
VKNDRVGDWLWEEWDGEGYESENPYSSAIYCTYDWVDIDNDLVKRALASCLQRDGVVDSLGDGFKIAENALIIKSYAGFIDKEKTLTVCNEYGETDLGDSVQLVSLLTLIDF